MMNKKNPTNKKKATSGKKSITHLEEEKIEGDKVLGGLTATILNFGVGGNNGGNSGG